MSKKPYNIYYNNSDPLDTIIAYVAGISFMAAESVTYIPMNTAEEVRLAKQEYEDIFKKPDDVVNAYFFNIIESKDDIKENYFADTDLPRVIKCLTFAPTPDYWALHVAWECIEHDLNTDDGRDFIQGLVDSKMYGTETNDESQQWNALHQTINLGNTMCLALANAYRKGADDGTAFCKMMQPIIEQELVDVEKTFSPLQAVPTK